MNFRFNLKQAVLVTGLMAAGGGAFAQDIKLGFNGDLSASPSAQSGKAGGASAGARP